MYERDGDTGEFSFQWVIGDTSELEKNLVELGRPTQFVAIMFVSRLVAYGLTFALAYILLPSASLTIVLGIAAAGSLTLWVSFGLEIRTVKTIEKLRALDPIKAGWNFVRLDPSGIVWVTETSEEYVSWMGIIEVVERERSLWFKTGEAQGYYLPPRMFETEAELADFRDLVARLRESPLPPAHISRDDEILVKH